MGGQPGTTLRQKTGPDTDTIAGMTPRPALRLAFGRTLAGMLAVALLITSCSERELGLSEWETAWEQTADRVEQARADTIPEERCQEVLSFLRERRDLLQPAPLRSLDSPIDSWFELAEASFFDCPPQRDEIDGWRAAFDELNVIEEEIETVLEAEM